MKLLNIDMPHNLNYLIYLYLFGIINVVLFSIRNFKPKIQVFDFVLSQPFGLVHIDTQHNPKNEARNTVHQVIPSQPD